MLRCALQCRRPYDVHVQQRVWPPDILMSHWVTVLQCALECPPWFPFLKCCITVQVFPNVGGSGTWVQLLCSEEKHIMRSKAKVESSVCILSICSCRAARAWINTSSYTNSFYKYLMDVDGNFRLRLLRIFSRVKTMPERVLGCFLAGALPRLRRSNVDA